MIGALAVAALAALVVAPRPAGGAPTAAVAATAAGASTAAVAPSVVRPTAVATAPHARTAPTSLAPLPPTPGPLTTSTTSPPVSVAIPAIGVDSPLETLGLAPDGSLTPPVDFARAGWFAAGPRPGDLGPAVIAGHVDSYRGPAVFFRLVELAPGATVLVTRADGSVVRFVVTSVRSYPKGAFPTAAVYGPTPTPELRLITCTGSFDTAARSYRDDLVVDAALT